MACNVARAREMVCGYSPFSWQSGANVLANIVERPLEFPEDSSDDDDDDDDEGGDAMEDEGGGAPRRAEEARLRGTIARMLDKDPAARMPVGGLVAALAWCCPE